METLFASLSEAVHGSAPVAMGAAFAWGVLSIVLSPCHLASVPLLIAYLGDQGTVSGRRAFAITLVFALGILLTIAAVGGVTAALGRILGDVGRTVNWILALVFLYLGLHFLDVAPLPWSGGGRSAPRRRGVVGALALGLLFGIGVGPCTFAFLAPMLGVALKASASRAWHGAALLLLYGVGHCVVIVLAGTSFSRAQRVLDWQAGSRGAVRLRQACGVLVILGGAYLVYTAP